MTAQTDRLNNALAGRYRILRHLGEGGMATVYLCDDLRHDRKVALKLLKPELAAVLGAERFVQEIKTTAALQHPHILPLFDSGVADGFLFYVMPFIDGETLRAKLDRETQLGVDDAIRIAREVADALNYAHERGIVHRDVKPENIMLHGGHAMVADFGIALAVSAAAGGRMTETGLSLGTPHYMSPEQATAEKEITARSDIYSLGSVLYEMLTGNPPHTGASAQQIIMKIITVTPVPVTDLRKSVPAHVAQAVEKSLEKLPADRFESAKSFADALVNPAFHTLHTGQRTTTRANRGVGSSRLFMATTAFLSLAVAALLIREWRRPDPPSPLPTRFTIDLPDSLGTANLGFTNVVAVSPDGSEFVYRGVGRTGAMFYRRHLNDLSVFEVPGSFGWIYARYTTDGQSLIGRDANGTLWNLPFSGGASIRVADSVASYSEGDGAVAFIKARTGALWRVSATGGKPAFVCAPDSLELFSQPWMLPGTRAVLVTIQRRRGRQSDARDDDVLGVVNLADGKLTRLGVPGYEPRYVPGAILLRQADGGMAAVRFNLSSLNVEGEPMTILNGLVQPFALVDISMNGVVVAMEGDRNRTPMLVDRARREQKLTFAAGKYTHPRLSPTGDRIALQVNTGTKYDVYVLTLKTGQVLPLTRDGHSRSPEWSPDGEHVAWIREADSSRTNGTIMWRRSDGSGPEEVIATPGKMVFFFTFAPTATFLAASVGPGHRHDIDLVPLDNSSQPRPIVNSTGDEREPSVSPDGKWMAYVSSDVGANNQVWIANIENPSTQIPITTEGAAAPVWLASGNTLVYATKTRVVAATIAFTPRIAVTRVDTLFADATYSGGADRTWDVNPKTGELLVLAGDSMQQSRLVVATGWLDELKQRMARTTKP